MAVQFLIGIDEAGRGPIAGPVSVGAVMIPVDFDPIFFEGIRDSKQLSAQSREVWYQKMHDHSHVHVSVSMVSAVHIDERGIVHAIKTAMRHSLDELMEDLSPAEVTVLLDGSLYAPKEFVHQQTIIKGDEKEPVISMASIAAKVTRDRFMMKAAEKYPKYGFEVHKGYGTKAHYKAIESAGLSDLHRKSFLTKSGFATGS